MKTTSLAIVATLCAALFASAAPGDPAGVTPAVKPSAGPARQTGEFRVGKIGKSGAQSHETTAKLRRLFNELNTDQGESKGRWIETVVGSIALTAGDTAVYVCPDPAGSGPGFRIALVSALPGLKIGSPISGLFAREGVHDSLPRWVAAVSKPLPRPMTREDFLARLKAGGTFTVTLLESGDCHGCFGRGNLGTLKRNAPCPACGATGAAIITYTLRW